MSLLDWLFKPTEKHQFDSRNPEGLPLPEELIKKLKKLNGKRFKMPKVRDIGSVPVKPNYFNQEDYVFLLEYAEKNLSSLMLSVIENKLFKSLEIKSYSFNFTCVMEVLGYMHSDDKNVEFAVSRIDYDSGSSKISCGDDKIRCNELLRKILNNRFFSSDSVIDLFGELNGDNFDEIFFVDNIEIPYSEYKELTFTPHIEGNSSNYDVLYYDIQLKDVELLVEDKQYKFEFKDSEFLRKLFNLIDSEEG